VNKSKQRRRDDVVSEVDAVKMLQCIHPVYRLASDSLSFLIGVARSVAVVVLDVANRIASSASSDVATITPESFMNGAL
jgi:hypothetical protein